MSRVTQYPCGCHKLAVRELQLAGATAALQVGLVVSGTLQLLQGEPPCNAVAPVYPQITCTATPTCISHSGITLFETHIAGQRNQDVYI